MNLEKGGAEAVGMEVLRLSGAVREVDSVAGLLAGVELLFARAGHLAAGSDHEQSADLCAVRNVLGPALAGMRDHLGVHRVAVPDMSYQEGPDGFPSASDEASRVVPLVLGLRNLQALEAIMAACKLRGEQLLSNGLSHAPDSDVRAAPGPSPEERAVVEDLRFGVIGSPASLEATGKSRIGFYPQQDAAGVFLVVQAERAQRVIVTDDPVIIVRVGQGGELWLYRPSLTAAGGWEPFRMARTSEAWPVYLKVFDSIFPGVYRGARDKQGVILEGR